MKGTTYNGGYFASKGTCRSEGISMISVGNLVAFSYKHSSSPDGRDGRDGANLLSSPYLLQEEILLEEYNNTQEDKFHSGNYDYKKIVDIADVWNHEEGCWQRFGGYINKFICSIMDTDVPQLQNLFAQGMRIEEVRNNPGKFLHVYLLDDADFIIALNQKSFDEAIAAVKKDSSKNKAAFGLANWKIGAPIPVQYSKQDYYSPGASVGGDGTSSSDTWCSHSRSAFLSIMPCVPAGDHNIYIFGYSASINIPNRTENSLPCLNLNVQRHWANSQNWRETPLTETKIEKGWFFFNGEDIYEATMTEAKKNRDAQITARNEKFAAAKTAAMEAGFTDNQITQLLKIGKGKTINLLTTAATISRLDCFTADLAFSTINLLRNENCDVISNYAGLVSKSKSIDYSRIKKVNQKASAWAYLRSALPEVKFSGYFDDALRAVKLTIENKVIFKNMNLSLYYGEAVPTTIGDILGDLSKELYANC
jgi:hypothetical protein